MVYRFAIEFLKSIAIITVLPLVLGVAAEIVGWCYLTVTLTAHLPRVGPGLLLAYLA
jgi:hypothetical protein